MGSLSLFQCPTCGHRVEASGESDVGMARATQTILCEQCAEVSDVVTHATELGNWPPGDTEEETPAAPLACAQDASHPVRPWPDEHPCPKCGTSMGEGTPFMLWD